MNFTIIGYQTSNLQYRSILNHLPNNSPLNYLNTRLPETRPPNPQSSHTSHTLQRAGNRVTAPAPSLYICRRAIFVSTHISHSRSRSMLASTNFARSYVCVVQHRRTRLIGIVGRPPPLVVYNERSRESAIMTVRYVDKSRC